MKTIKGPGIFLAQFAADDAPFNSWDSIAKWAADCGYEGVQVPSWDGHIFDLGGGVAVEAVHLPGHTRGHSGFRMDGVFFLSDIDLTGFGPYYGDMWSDLDDFDESLAKVRHEEADFYVTFHHKGIIEGRELFLEMLDGFAAVIPRRHAEMLEFLAEPHSIAEMAEHRFIYRPDVEMPIVEPVERRSADLHVQRMLQRGEAVEVEPGRYHRT